MLNVKESGGGSVKEYIVKRKGYSGEGSAWGWNHAVVALVVVSVVSVGVAAVGSATMGGPAALMRAVQRGKWLNESPSATTATVVAFLLPSIIAVVLGLAHWRQQTVEESVLCIRGLGLQLKSKKRNGDERYTFYEREKISEVYINESFHRFEPRYYLAFKVKGLKKLVLAFPETMPGIETNRKVYHGCKTMLIGEGGEGGEGGGGAGGGVGGIGGEGRRIRQRRARDDGEEREARGKR